MKKEKKFSKYLSISKYKELLPYFKEKKATSFTMIILTFLALSLFGVFAISPTLATIAQLRRQLADNLEVAQKLDTKIANLANLQQEYSLITDQLPIVYEAIPEQPSVPLFVGQVQAIGQDTNITITRLQTFQVELAKRGETGTPTQLKAGSFNFSIEATGTAENLNSFINTLVFYDRIITIDSIQYNSNVESSSGIQLGIRGKAYFMK